MKDIKEPAMLKKEKIIHESVLKKDEKNPKNKFIEIVDDLMIEECLDIISGLLDIGND